MGKPFWVYLLFTADKLFDIMLLNYFSVNLELPQWIN